MTWNELAARIAEMPAEVRSKPARVHVLSTTCDDGEPVIGLRPVVDSDFDEVEPGAPPLSPDPRIIVNG